MSDPRLTALGWATYEVVKKWKMEKEKSKEEPKDSGSESGREQREA